MKVQRNFAKNAKDTDSVGSSELLESLLGEHLVGIHEAVPSKRVKAHHGKNYSGVQISIIPICVRVALNSRSKRFSPPGVVPLLGKSRKRMG
jgi:hypothetical protein